MTRLKEEHGFVGGFEALPFGFLVFLAGTLLIVNAWAVFDCHLAVTAAAREGVRAFVESDGSDGAALEAARAAAEEALTGHGKDVSRMSVSWSGAHLERCQPVSVTITYDVPTIAIPILGAFGGGVIHTSSTHREIVDPYRRGLAVDGFDAETCSA
jgi:hypothetical protein